MSRGGMGLVYAGVLALLAAACVWAAAERSITTALVEMAADRWGLMTLLDLYAAFFTVWLWVAWREPSPLARALWALLIAGLGSMAIALYVLLALRRLPAGASASALLRPVREGEA